MESSPLFREYNWLVQTILRAGTITFAEIKERWDNSPIAGGRKLSRSTFIRHKEALAENFGICIECDHENGYRYYVKNREVLGENSVQTWMLNTLSVHTLLSDSLQIRDRIILEDIPSANPYLKTMLDAMKGNRKMVIHYRRYESSETRLHHVSPYCLKLFKRCWYVLVKSEMGNMYILALDRIRQIVMRNENFVMDEDFDAESFFDKCFGVVVGKRAPEHIVLRAYGNERFRLRDVLMHKSQREIARGEDYVDFEYYVSLTDDLKAYILSRGPWVQVLSPKGLINDICRLLNDTLRRYSIENLGIFCIFLGGVA